MKTLKAIFVVWAMILLLPGCTQKAGNAADQNAGSAADQKADKAVVQKNIGLQLYSLRDSIGKNNENIDSVISRVGRMGYKYVEAANYNDGKFYGMTPEEFKAKLAAAGMFALSSHTSHPLADDISKTNWDEVWAWWDKCIADHKAAGMKFIVTPWMPTPKTLEGLQAYCDYYNKIGEKCAAAGLKFGYHNHNYEFLNKYLDGKLMDDNKPFNVADQKKTDKKGEVIAMYDYMLAHTDPAKVFFEMDVYWAMMGQRSQVELFKNNPGRFLALHIKDDKELGESGMVGFDAIFNNLATAGTKYPIVEVERYGIPPYESVQKSLDYLNNAPFVKADYSK